MAKRIILSLVLAAIGTSHFCWASEELELNLSDLGVTEQSMTPSPELHKKLEDRRFYLRQHQIWGLVSTGAMVLTVLSGGEGSLPPEHPYIAGLAFTSYAAAAYTAWMAPEVDENHKGATAWHRRLAWIHVPGMILAPILGYMAAKKIEKGEKLDGPEQYHKDVAGVTAVALAVSMLTVSIEF